jgi:hypothetical protein
MFSLIKTGATIGSSTGLEAKSAWRGFYTGFAPAASAIVLKGQGF